MNLKKFIPYAIAIASFAVVSLLYFNPVLSGKQIKQGDIAQFIGMSRQAKEHRVSTGEESYWLNNAFSGMPTYQVGAYFPNDFIRYVDKAIRFLPRPADYLFLYFFSFFILLTALKVDWKLAILGSLSFGFSTYMIIIFGAGHNAKAHAIGYMPLVLAGVVYLYQNKLLLGFALTSLAMGLEISTNHPQMTYYLGFCLLILGVTELVVAYKKQRLALFAKQSGLVILAAVLGLTVNATRLMATKEYADYSTRGKSSLTITPEGTPKKASTGLDTSYITEYSYGIAETFNLMIPRFMGGGTIEALGNDSSFYETIKLNAGPRVADEYSKQVYTYWGDQPIVEAPAYIGAVVFLLFFLGVFLVRDKLKYWLVAATIFSIMMSWGKNFAGLTNFFIDYIPLYNKFRAVSSIQVIAELCVPLLGVLALRDFFNAEISKEEKWDALKKSFMVMGGISLVFLLFGGSLFHFEGLRDGSYQQLPELQGALIRDRKDMLFNDSLRTLILVSITTGALWAFLQDKLKLVPVLLVLGGLVVFDLVSVDIKYVNKEDFTSKRKVMNPFKANQADKEILKDASYYRVANFTGNVLNEARTSYFHNSIGGYHAAKMKRYQELFEYQLAKNNTEILNMLNTKYMIVGENKVQKNPDANGPAWFVNELLLVRSANEEIQGLDSLNTKRTALLNVEDFKEFSGSQKSVLFPKDSTARITMTAFKPNAITYTTSTEQEQYAVFSEMYYGKGWNAYVDDVLTPHQRVDYVLRGMKVPAGKHTIVFKFEPSVIQRGSMVSLLGYVFMILLPVGGYFYQRKKS